MPGKMTRPDDGRRNNPGGYRGGGRPRLTDPSESKARKIHQVRAHDHEWPVIKRFIDCTRLDMGLCEAIIDELELRIRRKQESLEKQARQFAKPTVAQKAAKARELSEAGKTQEEIAQVLNLSRARISQLLNMS